MTLSLLHRILHGLKGALHHVVQIIPITLRAKLVVDNGRMSALLLMNGLGRLGNLHEVFRFGVVDGRVLRRRQRRCQGLFQNASARSQLLQPALVKSLITFFCFLQA